MMKLFKIFEPIRASLIKTILFLVINFGSIFSQDVDHWETVVYASDTWNYFVGLSEPDSGWKELAFDDSSWQQGPGGIGYGDGDDATEIIATTSLYMRHRFSIIDTVLIYKAIFNIDYDDAFVAYLNGVEIARANIGIVGDNPTYDQTSAGLNEAKMYQGGTPEYFNISHQQTTELLKTGENVLAIQVHNENIGSSDLSAIPFFSVGISDDTITYGDVPDWFIEPFEFESSNLPIIVVNTYGQSIVYEPKISAHMGIINNGEDRNNISDPYNEYDGHIGIEIRGQTSRSFDKKSYGFETRDSLGENRNVNLLGMPRENDWVLHGPYSDKSLMRNALSYTLAGEMGNYAPRVRFCEVLINNVYRGVYVLTEKIKRDDSRIDITKLLSGDVSEPEVSGGYIFKKDKTNTGDNIIVLSRGLELIIIEPKNDEIVAQQTSWLRNHLNIFENVLYAGGDYSQYIDVQSFVDNFLMVELTKNIDGYRLSTYFYKDRNEKIVAAPVWDYNLSLGNADYNYGWSSIGWYHPLISSWDKNWWMELLRDQDFYKECKIRWNELRSNEFSEAHIFSIVDEWVELLNEAQERNFIQYPILGHYVWPNPGFPESGNFGYSPPTTGGPTTWNEEIAYLKNFINGRLAWMDEELRLDISGILPDNSTEITTFDLYPNYPNPFNAKTKIIFSLKNSGKVSLTLYDLNGKIIKTLLSRSFSAGTHSYTLDASDLASGIYVYKIIAGSFEMSRKMILIK